MKRMLASSGLAMFAMVSGLAQSLPSPAPVQVSTPANGHEVVLPKWENGFFASFDAPGDSLSPLVYVHDRNGKALFDFAVTVPESVDTGITDLAVAPSGQIAVAGGGAVADGRNSGFIAFFGTKGEARFMVRTSPFLARRIRFANDGSLWALGWELSADGAERPVYDMLRQYGPDGKLMRSAMPRSIFRAPGSSILQQSYLAVFGDSAGVYSHKTNEWIVLSAKTGQIVERWTGLSGEKDMVVRALGVTASGSVFLTCDSGESRAIHKLDPSSKSWKPVAGMGGRIIGTSGEQLVLRTQGGDIVWAQ